LLVIISKFRSGLTWSKIRCSVKVAIEHLLIYLSSRQSQSGRVFYVNTKQLSTLL